ncbi:TipAS antibiotic-recognition domain-containing protein [Streptomyces sp. NPDC056480]|uniref:TipAS antibiotic-recognition domain-containing protein n=1 Tax=Streptomyces sp. NPDC056480 TaxID=3345833 RepID=UPI003675889A
MERGLARPPPAARRRWTSPRPTAARITTGFLECHPKNHEGLAGTYLADENFHAFQDSIHAGLPEHLHAAVRANARRPGA